MDTSTAGTHTRAAIFDVDGTLIDSNDLHIEAWREAFRQFGKDFTYEEVHAQMGKGGDQLMPVFLSSEELEKFGKALEHSRVELFVRDYLPKTTPFAGVRELFERLKADGIRIALASSAKEEELAHHKKNLGVDDLLEGATSADDAEHSKPYPDIFVAALERLKGVSSEQAIVIGDTPYDAEAAAKAGMRTIGLLSGGFSEERLRREGVIAVYRNVADLLERYDESPFARTSAAV
jgi:HAD superfamily hydrolase (TIGR01509 family)